MSQAYGKKIAPSSLNANPAEAMMTLLNGRLEGKQGLAIAADFRQSLYNISALREQPSATITVLILRGTSYLNFNFG